MEIIKKILDFPIIYEKDLQKKEKKENIIKTQNKYLKLIKEKAKKIINLLYFDKFIILLSCLSLITLLCMIISRIGSQSIILIKMSGYPILDIFFN